MSSRKKHRHCFRNSPAWVLMGLLVTILLIPLPGYLLSDRAIAQTGAVQEQNPQASFWREVRRGAEGYSAVSGQERNVLIQNGGENWRALRNGPIAVYGAWLVAGVVLVAGLVHLIKGQQKIESGRSGLTIARWTAFERVMHWYVALLFVTLAVTGLSLLYGRNVLIPIMGKDGFAAYAQVAKMIHDYVGPLFSVGVILMILRWFRDNLPIKADFEWAKTAGGMWGHGHPPAGKANAGEKLMFWQFVVTGLALVATGFVLDFPNFGQSREVMQWSHVIHAVAAIIAIVTAMGHMYMALLGVEGAMEGMIGGRVDTNWAKQHHDLWYKEMIEKGVRPEPAAQRPVKSGTGFAEPRST